PTAGGFHMEPRKFEKRESKAPTVRTEMPKSKLRIVKLEERITPGRDINHNETLVREPAKSPRIVKLEERIAPGTSLQHNETLVCDAAKATPKSKLRILKLEERIAPSNGNFPPGQFPSGNP